MCGLLVLRIHHFLCLFIFLLQVGNTDRSGRGGCRVRVPGPRRAPQGLPRAPHSALVGIGHLSSGSSTAVGQSGATRLYSRRSLLCGRGRREEARDPVHPYWRGSRWHGLPENSTTRCRSDALVCTNHRTVTSLVPVMMATLSRCSLSGDGGAAYPLARPDPTRPSGDAFGKLSHSHNNNNNCS